MALPSCSWNMAATTWHASFSEIRGSSGKHQSLMILDGISLHHYTVEKCSRNDFLLEDYCWIWRGLLFLAGFRWAVHREKTPSFYPALEDRSECVSSWRSTDVSCRNLETERKKKHFPPPIYWHKYNYNAIYYPRYKMKSFKKDWILCGFSQCISMKLFRPDVLIILMH